MINWQNIKYDLADFFFGSAMDEAYEQGIRIGAEYATRKISFAVGVKEAKAGLTKTQKIGYDKANAIVQSCKTDIANTTGAML